VQSEKLTKNQKLIVYTLSHFLIT